MEDNGKLTFEQVLEKDGKLIYTTVGDSMWPLLRQKKDLVVIIPKPEGRLKRYDVPLYRRDSDRQAGNGKYVLHRILRVRKKGYIICGDNRWALERDIDDSHIIGVMTAIVRGGLDPAEDQPETIVTSDLRYRIYMHIWCDLFPLRSFLFWLRDLPRRALRYLRRSFKS